MATATALDVLTSASRRLGILPGEEALNAAEAADSLVIMNRMMNGFGPMGIAYVHAADLVLSGRVNMPDELIRPLILMVANELADEFSMTVSPRLEIQIAEAKSTLQAYYYIGKPGITDPVLRPRAFGRFDITNLDE